MGIIKDEIAKNILFYRKRAKLSQKQIAEQLGISIPAISNWENGTNSIDIETLFKLCDILGVSINEMYGIEKEYKHEDFTPHHHTIIKQYDSLDSYGKTLIDNTLAHEYKRCEAQKS